MLQRRSANDARTGRAAPLLDKSDIEDGGMCRVGVASRKPLVGLAFVTTAALLFGVVAACVKSIMLPTLVMQLCRSMIEWVLGVVAALVYWRRRKPEPEHEPELMRPSSCADASCESGRSQGSGVPTDLKGLLIGPPHLRGWLFLRALLYWIFLAGWWFALTSMPIGDATTIVYVAPVFTATFAYLFLGERVDWSFYGVVVLDAIGLVFITQPTFLFPISSGSSGGSSHSSGGSKGDGSYYLGALSAFTAAVVAGLLPICTRKSKACFWTAVNHSSSALSALVFTPLAIAVWVWVDADAPAAIAHSISELFGVPLNPASTPPAGFHPMSPGDALHGPAGFQLGKWLLLFGATFTGFVGLALQTLGYQLEEAARASVMTVLEIPFAYVLQHYCFQEEITPLGLVGVSLICFATTLNLLRRLQLARRAL